MNKDVNLNPIQIKERKLKCGLHNTWSFINANGIDNSVTLSKKEHVLFYKGVTHIDNYFSDESIAFVMELSYTCIIYFNYIVLLPGLNNREDYLNIILGYSVLITDIDMDNNYRTTNLITGPGMTVYGEYLYDSLESEDKNIKINFILSKNKESIDKTYKEKEIELMKSRIDLMKKTMQDDFSKQLYDQKSRYDREREDLMKKRSMDLEEMENRLRESQRSLKMVYDKDDVDYDDFRRRDEETKREQSWNIMSKNKKEENITMKQDRIIEENVGADHSRNFDTTHDVIRENTEDHLPVPKPNFNNNSDIYPTKADYSHEQDNKTKTINNNQSNFYERPEEYEERKVDRERDRERDRDREIDDYNRKKDNSRYNNYESKTSKFYQVEGKLEGADTRVIYDTSTKDISRRDKAELIAKGLLNLDMNEQSKNLLAYTMDKELADDKKANNFSFHFLSYKPLSDIKDYNTVPDKIFFRFNFWDYEIFNTSIASVCKPKSSIVPSSTPLILQREMAPLNAKSGKFNYNIFRRKRNENPN